VIVRGPEKYPEYFKFNLRDHFFSHFSQVLLNNIDPSVCGYSARFRAHRTIKSSKRKTELVQNPSVGHSPGGGGGWGVVRPEKSGWVVRPAH